MAEADRRVSCRPQRGCRQVSDRSHTLEFTECRPGFPLFRISLGHRWLPPDLFKAVADLQPASIRWPGGSFANRYIWQNGIGPREKRLPHPIDQWGDRDTYQFGTDEFIQFCEKVGAEPILVLNTSRGVEDALNWLEYCMGDASTEYGKQRAANGHPAPYQLETLEIDNEPWLMMDYSSTWISSNGSVLPSGPSTRN